MRLGRAWWSSKAISLSRSPRSGACSPRRPEASAGCETLARRGYRFVGPVTTLPDVPSPSAAGETRRTNLPESLTSFVGRERELVEIKRLLPATRLLTLVGIGGIGKTRLALQVAAEVMDAYRDGVWFVDLAPLDDPLRWCQARWPRRWGCAKRREAISWRRCPGRSRGASSCWCSTIASICSRRVLDSPSPCCAARRQSTIIATSREPLHIPGEQTYPLPTLSLPDPSASVDDDDELGSRAALRRAGAAAAARLRVDRRRSRRSRRSCASISTAFRWRSNWRPRVSVRLSIEQINARLDDRFKLLTGGSRTALPRQQTLRGTLDWSHGLLTEHERVVLRRLAIFTGGFTLEAAAAVASDESIDEFAVIDVLSQLVAALAGRRRHERGGRALPAARDHPRLCAGEARRGRRNRRHQASACAAFAIGSSAPPTTGCACPTRTGARSTFPSATTFARRSTGRSVRVATRPSASRSPAPPERLGGLSLPGEGLQRLEAAVAQVESHTSKSDQARLWFWLGLIGGMAASPRRRWHWSGPATLYRRVDDRRDWAITLTRPARVLARMGQFERSAPHWRKHFR